MAIFKRVNKNEDKKEKIKDDLKDELSKAYDEIVSGNDEKDNGAIPKAMDAKEFDNEVFKSKLREFKANKNQENLIAALKMLSGRHFLLPSVSNMEEPLVKSENGAKLKEGAVFNPAFLTSTDNKVFLPIFTDEKAMVQKSPSGVIMKLTFEQCVTIIFDEKNPVQSVVINPFTENMIIGIDLLKMIFKEKKTEEN